MISQNFINNTMEKLHVILIEDHRELTEASAK